MSQLADKIILLCVSLLFQSFFPLSIYSVILFLSALAFSLVLSLWKHDILTLFVLIVYLGCCWQHLIFLVYAPLLSYDIYHAKQRWKGGICLLIPLCFLPQSLQFCPFVLIGESIAFLMKERQERYAYLNTIYREQRDASKELSILLEEKHHDLLMRQDYEIRLATMNERNRIAREIHDNVGHLLSSSLLQIGAIKAIYGVQEPLLNLEQTLNEAMSSVRNSVHDLHEDALDLSMEIQKLLDALPIANTKLEYELSMTLQREVKYQLLAIIKEALHNIVKHANATQVSITLREHPSFLQLIIQDNGTKQQQEHEPGIGLHNMEQRVSSFHGHMNINQEHGFQIFITLPKEELL